MNPQRLAPLTVFETAPVASRVASPWWSGWRDLNPRPHAPEACALPSCATTRWSGRPDSNRRPRGPRPLALPSYATSRCRRAGPTEHGIRYGARLMSGPARCVPLTGVEPACHSFVGCCSSVELQGPEYRRRESNTLPPPYQSGALTTRATTAWRRMRDSNPRRYDPLRVSNPLPYHSANPPWRRRRGSNPRPPA